jgi:hypothetical protein
MPYHGPQQFPIRLIQLLPSPNDSFLEAVIIKSRFGGTFLENRSNIFLDIPKPKISGNKKIQLPENSLKNTLTGFVMWLGLQILEFLPVLSLLVLRFVFLVRYR